MMGIASLHPSYGFIGLQRVVAARLFQDIAVDRGVGARA
jgi:hypothetical protein